MENNKVLISTQTTHLSLREGSIIVYNTQKGEVAKKQNKNSMNNLRQGGAYSGQMQPSARRRIRRDIVEIAAAAEHGGLFIPNGPGRFSRERVMFSFLTLTLSSGQLHSDEQIKRELLTPFLSTIRRCFNIVIYIWTSEVQENGNIHFHLVVDRYIPQVRLREIWNRMQENLGYVSRYNQNKKHSYKNGFKLEKRKLLRDSKKVRKQCIRVLETKKINFHTHERHLEYLKNMLKEGRELSPKILNDIATEIQEIDYQNGLKYGFYNPNSTDVKEAKDVGSVGSYITKYLVKDKEQPLDKNQVTVNENGIKYLIEYDDSGGEIIRKEIYKPKFLCRPIGGKVWGCSKEFSNYNVVRKEKVENGGEIERIEIKKVAPLSLPISETKFYRDLTKSENQIDSISFEEVVLEPQAMKLISYLETEIGEKEIARISEFAGDYFYCNGGRIYPFTNINNLLNKITLNSLLQNKAPSIALKLSEHRSEMCNSIWQLAA